MKKLRIIPILLFLFSTTLTSCEKSVEVQFHNETGYDIHELVISGKPIGLLPKNESSAIVEYDGLYKIGNQLELQSEGKIDHQTLENHPFFECGTGYNQKKVGFGNYKVSIQLIESDSTRYLDCITLY